jgi:hypothetical protein
MLPRPKARGQAMWIELPKTVSFNQPLLFIGLLSLVFVMVMESWLAQGLSVILDYLFIYFK